MLGCDIFIAESGLFITDDWYWAQVPSWKVHGIEGGSLTGKIVST